MIEICSNDKTKIVALNDNEINVKGTNELKSLHDELKNKTIDNKDKNELGRIAKNYRAEQLRLETIKTTIRDIEYIKKNIGWIEYFKSFFVKTDNYDKISEKKSFVEPLKSEALLTSHEII